jgi:hypothetical protein
MSVLDKFRKGALKAGIQATTFIKEGSSRGAVVVAVVRAGLQLARREAEKAAKILATFLGLSSPPSTPTRPGVALTENSFPKADPDQPRICPQLDPQGRSCSVREVRPLLSLLPPTFLRSPAHSRCPPTFENVRPRRLPGPQGRLRFLRESRLRPCHITLTGWLVVRPILHRDRWGRLGSPDRRGHHRLRHRPQQRGCSPRILPRRKRHHRRQCQCHRRTHRHRRERPSEPRTSCADVLLLQV